VQAIYEIAPVIADVIGAHCPNTAARDRFLTACLRGHWEEVRSMVEGMLAEPWVLRGHQEDRLRDFLDLLPFDGAPASAPASTGPATARL
jgi:hypothetical protein